MSDNLTCSLDRFCRFFENFAGAGFRLLKLRVYLIAYPRVYFIVDIAAYKYVQSEMITKTKGGIIKSLFLFHYINYYNETFLWVYARRPTFLYYLTSFREM